MTPETRLKRVQQFIGRMPSLSTTVAKVLEICNNPRASANDLNRVISYDPVLTGQMLKLINSAYYGMPNRITSLTRAIIMLGINTVKNLVLATSVLKGCKGLSNARQISVDDFWAHCLCVGVLAKLIAATCRVPAAEQEEYFVAGLLHDLGKVPMMACFPELYNRAVVASREQNRPLFECEMHHIGFSHCQAGVLIAAKWKLGQAMQNAINGHHARKENGGAGFMIDSVGVANDMANFFGVGSAGDLFVDPLGPDARLQSLGISVEKLTGLKSQMEFEMDKARVFLELV